MTGCGRSPHLIRMLIFFGKTGQSPSLIVEHFPGTVTDFTNFSLPPRIAFTFELLPKNDNVSLCWFHMPPRVQITFYLPPPPPDHFLCTSPTYQVALVPFHQKRCYWPYLCFYHTSPPLVYHHPRLKLLLIYLSLVKVNFCSSTVCSRITFSIPPSWANVTFCTPHDQNLTFSILHLGMNVLFIYLRNL
jgi:hypothetical protein